MTFDGFLRGWWDWELEILRWDPEIAKLEICTSERVIGDLTPFRGDFKGLFESLKEIPVQ